MPDFEKDWDKALKQIEDRQYAVNYEEYFAEILCYGISFYKKRCLVKMAESLMGIDHN